MKFLNHLDPADYRLLKSIDDNWPFQFLSGFSRFYLHYHNSPVYIAYDEGLNAYMPLRFLRLKVFHPAQILFAPMRNGVELSGEEQAVFFKNFIWALYYRGHCERLIQPHPYGILADHPPGSKYCDFGTYIIDLEHQTPEQIFSRFHPKYQKAVTHSVKHDAKVRIGRETMNDFYRIYSHTMERVGLHFEGQDYFQELYNYLGEDHIAVGVVYDGDEPVSGIFLLYSKYSAFLTHAGTMGESKLYGAAKLLNFEMMKYLKRKGVKRYDFVGVRINNQNPDLDGIFRFKKGFGGDLKTGYLWKLDLLPMKARVYDSVVTFRSGKEKIKDIIDQISETEQHNSH